MVESVSIPAKATTCDGIQCPDYLWNPDASRSCSGGACASTCCVAVACAQVPCKYPLVRNFLHADKTCSSEGQCADLCCLAPCSQYECPSDSCSMGNWWDVP